MTNVLYHSDWCPIVMCKQWYDEVTSMRDDEGVGVLHNKVKEMSF